MMCSPSVVFVQLVCEMGQALRLCIKKILRAGSDVYYVGANAYCWSVFSCTMGLWSNKVKCFMSLLKLLAQPSLLRFLALSVLCDWGIMKGGNYVACMSKKNYLHSNQGKPNFAGELAQSGHFCQVMSRSRNQNQPQLQEQGSILERLSLEEALHRLENCNERPSVEDFICILQKCRKMKDLAYAHRVYACIRHNAYEAYKSLGNHIVPMFVDCGSVFDAEEVFNRINFRNVHSWTSLILGYIQSGQLQHALDLYHKMQEDRVNPSSYTLVALIKACVRLKDVRQVHDEVVQTGFECDLFVGSSLIDTYAKYGSLMEALEVFNMLSVRNVVTWNALISGYAEHGLGYEAIKCFKQMQLEEVCPDDATFIGILKACSSLRVIEKGRVIHVEILHRGFERDLSIGNTLVDMYAKCGLASEARLVFDKLSVRSVVSWNALIGGYAEHGLDQEALNCFDLMQTEGVFHNSVTFVCVIKACGNIAASDKGKEIHMEIAQKGYEGDFVLCSTLVDMYAKSGSMVEAWAASCTLPFRDVVLWNSLIAGYAEHGPGYEVLECFEKMQLQGISPNNITFTNILKACGNLGALGKGLALHTEVIMRGFEEDLFVGSSLVDMYVKYGSLMEAQEVFDKLSARNVVSWTALISGYAEHGFGQEALTYFEQAQHEGISPNAAMFASALKSCSSIGSIEKGREIHMEIIEKGLEKEVVVANTLIDIYSKCCSVAEAKKVFETLPIRAVQTWNAMIKGYGMNHEGNMAVQLFKDMQNQHVKPNAITFTCILNACSHASLVLKGQAIFKLLKEEYGIVPTLDNYACMVDLLARSGHLYEAEKFLNTMPCSPSQDMWFALLSACKTHADADVGHRCFEQLIHMDPDCAAPYLLLSDIYASAGRWNDVYRLDELRKHAGAKKKPATALIEVNNYMHEFVVGDNESSELAATLKSLNLRLEEEGHVPNVDLVLRPSYALCD